MGSGPGGAVSACLLAEAGREVVLIEEGPSLTLADTEPFSRDEMRRKYRYGGLGVALGNPSIAYAEGRCLGGGSEVNSGLYHRTPPEILERWSREFGLRESGVEAMRGHFEVCEKDLSVSLLPGEAPAASLRLRDGAFALGWQAMEVPRWQRYGSENAEGIRQSMTETYLPRARQAGCRIVASTAALRIRREAGRFRVRCVTEREGKRIEEDVVADSLVLACGALQTPALLRRSGMRRNVGRTLHFHPTVKVIARFGEAVNAPGMGVPVHQVKEFSPRVGLGCAISQPPHLALAMVDHPDAIAPVLEDWTHHAVYYAMIGGGVGSVTPIPGFRDPLVRFALEKADFVDLADGLRYLCECLFAAGAETLYPTVGGLGPLRSEADIAALPARLPRATTSLMTIHAFSTCPMGENEARCVTDSFGRVHGIPGLRIADASLLCSPPGVNPQGSVMAFARRNALAWLEEGR